jgi:hypothetical protein
VGCGVWGVGCGVWGVGCGVWGVGWGGDLLRSRRGFCPDEIVAAYLVIALNKETRVGTPNTSL